MRIYDLFDDLNFFFIIQDYSQQNLLTHIVNTQYKDI
jgi:hypothetical protein